jgi:fructoselysine 6-phosphate deglycase
MTIEIDRNAFLQGLDKAVFEKDKAFALGVDLARQGIKRVFLIGCGAPNREMGAIKYWLDRDAKTLETYLYFPAEFNNQSPAKLGADSLVVLASHSGTTPEILQTAECMKDYPCKVVAVTQFEDSPLAKSVKDTFIYGKSDQGYYAKFIILMALLAGVMQEIEDWKLTDSVMNGLNALPSALVDTAEANEKRAIEETRLYKDDDFMMILGSGPQYATAYVFGVCVLMEMQWMHTFTGEAAEFFHGPFEVIDQNTPVVVFLGEDPSRPVAERVVRFCRKFTERLMICDSKDYEMKGIAPEVRAIFAPFILEAAISRVSEHLAVWHNHPLSTRRYMWKFEY